MIYIYGIPLLVVTRRSEISTIKVINVGIWVHKYRDVMEQENEEGIRRTERKGCDRRVKEKRWGENNGGERSQNGGDVRNKWSRIRKSYRRTRKEETGEGAKGYPDGASAAVSQDEEVRRTEDVCN